MSNKYAFLTSCLLLLFLLSACTPSGKKQILVFSKTNGFRHESIEAGITAIEMLGQENNFAVVVTEADSVFSDATLSQYDAIVFLNTSGELLDPTQRIAFRRYIQAGGGFVGIHGAATTEYSWPWYNQLLGAQFDDHPAIQEARIQVDDPNHLSTQHLDAEWIRTDEWYNFKNRYPHTQVLLSLDESSYDGGKHPDGHPIAWYHEYDGGRSFYTALGHTKESYTEPAFLQHLLGGIQYAMSTVVLDYEKETVMPEPSRFEKVVLDYYLDEPMELEMLPDGRLLFNERHGRINIYDPAEGRTSLLTEVEVYSQQEDGLLGMALDPNYEDNNWIYLFQSHPTDWEQHIMRYDLDPDATEPLSNPKLLLRIPVQRKECCHAAGSLEFGPNGHLFISTGDDTNPFASDGYGPIDERPGRAAWDAQRSSANTNDLRGKILRIKPEPDGTYSIPDGNLFPKDGSQGHPAIYVMGCRNPFRTSIDQRTGYLYWGDVGPDANEDHESRGPMGHDEVNQARKAGFFGWPYFVGNNKAYHDYDFARQVSGSPFDPAAPINDSPNNTGLKALPPAQAAMIYYPYRSTPVFPLMRSGGRNAMAGPIFYHDDYPDNPRRYPKYYDGKFFSYDWIRGLLLANTLDEEGDLQLQEHFLPNISWNNLVDIIMSPDGDMYMLEYGRGWNTANEDARLVHLKYTPGNRRPRARIEADKPVGGLPLTVTFDASTSSDPDGDALNYHWDFGGSQTAEGQIVTHTFTEAAAHLVRLTVKDQSGETDEAQIKIMAGNEAPQLAWKISGNQDFYWPEQVVAYTLSVEDREDGHLESGIDPARVGRSVEYLEQGYDLAEIAQGHQIVEARINNEAGLKLIQASDCASCHKEAAVSVGPSYLRVAEKYQGDPKALPYLANKIINGGSGTWGETAMAAHPDITLPKAEAMARYILSLGAVTEESDLPMAGELQLSPPPNKNPNGIFVFMANYVDQGAAGMDPIKEQAIATLRSPRIRASEYATLKGGEQLTVTRAVLPQLPYNQEGLEMSDGGIAAFGPMDLTDVRGLEFLLDLRAEESQGGQIDVLLDDPQGEAVAQMPVQPVITASQALVKNTLLLPTVEGQHTLYFRFSANNGNGARPICRLLSFTLKTEFSVVN
jgi:cytochrome c